MQGLPMGPVKVASLHQPRLPGEIMLWPGITPPPGWLFMDGSQLQKAAYPALYNALHFSLSGNVDTGTKTVTNTDTTNLAVNYSFNSGEAVGGVLLILSGTSFTYFSINPFSNGIQTLTFAPWGTASDISFELPNLEENFPIGASSTYPLAILGGSVNATVDGTTGAPSSLRGFTTGLTNAASNTHTHSFSKVISILPPYRAFNWIIKT